LRFRVTVYGKTGVELRIGGRVPRLQFLVAVSAWGGCYEGTSPTFSADGLFLLLSKSPLMSCCKRRDDDCATFRTPSSMPRRTIRTLDEGGWSGVCGT